MRKLYNEIVKHWRDNKEDIPWDEQRNPHWTRWVKETFCKLGKKKEI